MHSKERALDVIEFIQMLKLTGDFYGQPFLLLDWQYQIIWDVYGTLDDAGYRQYRYAYLEVPKKNGKTEMVAGLALYHLFNDPPSGEIYCCAAERDQAARTYKAAKQMIEQDPALQEMVKIVDSKKEIHNRDTGTFIKVLSSEAYSKHGLNPTVVIFDELHAQPNRDLWDVMTFGAGSARKEPLWWVITTAGDDPDRHSIGWEIHEKARKLIDGETVSLAWYAKIYGAPDDADIFDETVWYAANPSLGITPSIEAVRQEAEDARDSEAAEKLFRWLRLNQWVTLKRTGWIPLSLWDKTNGKWSLADLAGKRCYPGVDLSSTTDITAVCLLFPPQEDIPDWRAIFEPWIPEECMKERVKRDHVPYDIWVRQKHLHATPGNVIDYSFIEARLIALSKQYRFQLYGTDPWNSRMLTQRLYREGIEGIEIPQTMAHMSPAMKEIERLLKTGQFTHEENPVARWCCGNVIVAVDGNGNVKPMKDRSIEKIDLAVAMIIAMAAAMRIEAEQGKPSVYETCDSFRL